jgi:hypothetical protein
MQRDKPNKQVCIASSAFSPIWQVKADRCRYTVLARQSGALEMLYNVSVQSYCAEDIMIIIRFPDDATKRRALGWLTGRFSYKTWATGEMMVPEPALPALAMEGIRFSVEGPATYEQRIPAVRIPPAAAV